MHIVAMLFRRVGDSLLATPALRAIKQAHPNAELSVICERQVTRVFQANPWVDDVVRIDDSPSAFTLAAASRKHGRPDVLLDFLSDPRSAFATWLSRANERCGFARRGMNWAYTRSVPRQDVNHPIYSALHKLELVRALGIETTNITTEFHLTESDRAFADTAWKERGWNADTSVTAFFVHSRRDHKRWPLEHFHEVIRLMSDHGLSTPVILDTPGDENSVTELRARANLPASQSLKIGDLGQLGAVLARCRLLIGNDGGPKHVAVALGTPTLTIFGPDSPTYWTPPDSPIHVAISAMTEDVTASVRDVLPSTVYDAAAKLLMANYP